MTTPAKELNLVTTDLCCERANGSGNGAGARFDGPTHNRSRPARRAVRCETAQPLLGPPQSRSEHPAPIQRLRSNLLPVTRLLTEKGARTAQKGSLAAVFGANCNCDVGSSKTSSSTKCSCAAVLAVSGPSGQAEQCNIGGRVCRVATTVCSDYSNYRT